jgi:DNA-binding XRE family transcriptional regulator
MSISSIDDLAKALNISRQTFYNKKLKYIDYAQLFIFAQNYIYMRKKMKIPINIDEIITIDNKGFYIPPKAICKNINFQN